MTKSIIELLNEAGITWADEKIERFAALFKAEWLADAGEMPEPVLRVNNQPVVTLTQCQQAVAAAAAKKDAEIAQTHADWVRCDKAYHELKAELAKKDAELAQLAKFVIEVGGFWGNTKSVLIGPDSLAASINRGVEFETKLIQENTALKAERDRLRKALKKQ